jgi:predicted thioesterase
LPPIKNQTFDGIIGIIAIIMGIRKEPKVKTATFTTQFYCPQLVHGCNPAPVEKSSFPNVFSTSQVVELVERTSAKLLEEFAEEQCEALVTVRVEVNNLRPCLKGPFLTTVATFLRWEEQEGDKPAVIRVACTVVLQASWHGQMLGFLLSAG